MPKKDTNLSSKVEDYPYYFVEKVPGGYRVSTYADGVLTAVNEKVYFHPTSAYASLGRLLQRRHIHMFSLESDPAKAPVKEGK